MKSKVEKSFTFIDVIVGTALMLIIFLGIFGAYQLGLKVVSQSKAKITATSLANQELEKARNLPYSKVGIEGVDENGALKGTEYYPEGTQQYTINTDVSCVLDDADGLIPTDSCPCDYKEVTVAVSWSGQFGGEVSLATDIAPKNDLQECEKKGGVAEIYVSNAGEEELSGSVANIKVEVEDIVTGGKRYCFTDINGECTGENGIFLNPSPESEPFNYKITVPAPGTSFNYSTDQTYSSSPEFNPDNRHAKIDKGVATRKDFRIDLLGSKEIQTVKAQEWEDSNFTTKVDTSSNVEITEEGVKLARIDLEYENFGFIISTTITPEFLKSWKELNWNDSQPFNTNIEYKLLYFNGMDWVPILGFDNSPTDLSGLDVDTYNEIRLKAELTTEDTSITPILSDWKVDWISYIPNVAFGMHSEKTIGTEEGELIYKYDEILTTNSEGFINIEELEWGRYNIPITSSFTTPSEEFDLACSCPPQPIYLPPDSSITTTLTLKPHQNHTLLVVVKNSSGTSLIEEAQVELSKGSYYKILTTNSCGQVFFSPLEETTMENYYTMKITASGYIDYYNDNVGVSGQNVFPINMAEE